MRNIHNVSGMFFISVPVNSVQCHMLILFHQQHVVVDVAVFCILLQIFLLITYLMDPLFSSFSFLQLVSTILYLIIIYGFLVIVLLSALCRSSFLALALPLNSICGPVRYCLISSVFVLVSVFTALCVNAWSSRTSVLDSLTLLSLLHGFLCSIIRRLFQSWCSRRCFWFQCCYSICLTRLFWFMIACQLALYEPQFFFDFTAYPLVSISLSGLSFRLHDISSSHSIYGVVFGFDYMVSLLVPVFTALYLVMVLLFGLSCTSFLICVSLVCLPCGNLRSCLTSCRVFQ